MMRRCCFLLSLVLGAPLAARADEAVPKGFEPLFNGKNLTGWKVMDGKADAWGADSGILFVKGSGGGWLMTEAVALSGKPSKKLSVPSRVSTLFGAAMPGGMGVEYLYCRSAGGPLST